jgi:hypothetical protein
MPAGVSAYVPLATTTLSANAASVTFSSISQAYKDLILVVAPISTNNEEIVLQVNNDTAANYNYVYVRGTGSSSSSYLASAATYITLGANSYSGTTARGQKFIAINDYSVTDKHKSFLIRSNDVDNATEAGAARWANTAAITSLKVSGRFGVNFTSGATFALYGVSA